MEKKKLIEKIKDQLKALINPEKEVKFAMVKAGELMISTPDDELKVGSEVMILDDAGVGSPLTDGDYTLDSGMIIKVENGEVKEMMEKPEKTGVEIEIESGKKEEEKEMGYDKKEMEYNLEEKIAKLEEKLALIMDKIEMMGQSTEMMKKELSAISQLPASNKIEERSVEFRNIDEKKSNAVSIDLQNIRERVRRNR